MKHYYLDYNYFISIVRIHNIIYQFMLNTTLVYIINYMIWRVIVMIYYYIFFLSFLARRIHIFVLPLHFLI